MKTTNWYLAGKTVTCRNVGYFLSLKEAGLHWEKEGIPNEKYKWKPVQISIIKI